MTKAALPPDERKASGFPSPEQLVSLAARLSLAAKQGKKRRFECGTRILRVIHGRDARATSVN
jgi:hypothetical protein